MKRHETNKSGTTAAPELVVGHAVVLEVGVLDCAIAHDGSGVLRGIRTGQEGGRRSNQWETNGPTGDDRASDRGETSIESANSEVLEKVTALESFNANLEWCRALPESDGTDKFKK